MGTEDAETYIKRMPSGLGGYGSRGTGGVSLGDNYKSDLSRICKRIGGESYST